ncbi:MAG TPA: hypothetical protein DCE55_16235 [Planctomycetaceae bacterium]|nr:hypothetical protein [Planctomycetaceae bacterium]
MKLYERLGDKGFHTSIVTSFGIDFDAYESIAVSRLRASGSHNNILVVDQGMLTHALSGASSAPRYAGRQYLVSGASAAGVFHPKLTLQLGRKQGRVIISSANATASGLAGNLELAGIIECDQEESPEQRLVAAAWRYVERFLDRTLHSLNQQMSWMERRTPWLRRLDPAEGLIELSDNTSAEFLATTSDIGILDRFVARVATEAIERLIVISPYWDDDLTALRELHAGLRPQKTLVLIDKDRALFPNEDISGLENLQLVDIGPVAAGRFVHAKLVLAESSKFDHALFGSPNCTVAALGRSNFRGLNEETCLYRRVAPGAIRQALDLNQMIEDAAFTDTSSLPPYDSADTIPLTDLAESSPGSFEFVFGHLRWQPSSVFASTDAELELLAADQSVLQCELHRLDRQHDQEIRFAVSGLGQRPAFARARTSEGTVSAVAIISLADVLCGELREVGNTVTDRVARQLDQEVEEGLWLVDILQELEAARDPGVQRAAKKQTRAASTEDDQQQYDTVDYETFVKNRHLRSKGFDATRNSLAGTDFSIVRVFLNRVISLTEANDAEMVTDEEVNFARATDLGDELEDLEETQHRKLDARHSRVPDQSRDAKVISKRNQNQKQIDKATTQFIEYMDEIAEEGTLTSVDMLRLRAMLAIVIAAGLPNGQRDSGKKKSGGKPSPFQVLPKTGGEGTWPRLLGKLLFAVFGVRNPPISRLHIEDIHDQVPDDYLECWAYCFWSIHARIQAERDKPVLGAQQLVERIYKYSGLSKEDQLDKRVTTVMEGLGDRYAERLGLVHEEIMKLHQDVRS